MGEHGRSINLSESPNSDKQYNGECNRYKKEIDEILREESEIGLPNTMSPDEHLLPGGSEITFSQFKNAMKEKNLQHKTSTLNMNTQDLSTGTSQIETSDKELHTCNLQTKCTSILKPYTPKSISYIKRILESTKSMMPIDVSDGEDIVCVFESSETKSGLDESIKETDKNESNNVKCVFQQSTNLQHVKESISSYASSSNTSVISNSSRSNENKTHNNKRSASNEIGGLIKRKSARLKLSHSRVGDTVDGQVDEVQHQTDCIIVNGKESIREPEVLRPLQTSNNLEINKNLTKFKDVLGTEKNHSSFHQDQRLELASKAQSSQVHNENMFSHETSELSEICPRVCVKTIKAVNKMQQSCLNLESSVSLCVNEEILQNEKSFECSNKSCIKLAEQSDINVLDSKSPGKIETKNESSSDASSGNRKSLKNYKYKLLKNIFKLLLKSSIQNAVSDFISNDQEVQQLLNGWKLKMNVETNKEYSRNISRVCKTCESVSLSHNLKEDCGIRKNILCTKAIQTELSLINRDQCPSRSKWINESCSDSEADFDLNLLL